MEKYSLLVTSGRNIKMLKTLAVVSEFSFLMLLRENQLDF